VLNKSRFLEQLAVRLVNGGYRTSLLKVSLVACAYSAFVNNTAVVASLLGPLRDMKRYPPSRLLLPMVYAVSVGGVLTLVGTSTNLLINGFLLSAKLPGLRIFDPFPVGAALCVVTVLVIVATYPWLLPSRPRSTTAATDYFLEAEVRPDSRLIGRSIADNGLRQLDQLFLVELIRGGRLIPTVEPDEIIAAGDVLVFSGDVTRIDVLTRFHGLESFSQREGLLTENLVEVIVTSNSTLVKQTIKEANFRSQFDAAVVAVRRAGDRLRGKIGSIRLEAGDVLVLAVGHDFHRRNNVAKNFHVLSNRTVAKFLDHRKSLLALGAFVVMLTGSAMGYYPLVKGLAILLAGFLALRMTSLAELRRNVPFGLIFVIASSLVMAKVMMDTGAAKLIAARILDLATPWGAYGALVAVFLMTMTLTEMMTNNAAASLAFPIALGMAQHLGVNPMPFAMAVLYAASASFMTSFGYQTNLMVMGPGGYRETDYLKAGAPLSIAYAVTALLLIPKFFPF